MHILHLPSWYATADKPWHGAFVRDQAVALTRSGLRVGVAFVERRSLFRLTPSSLRDSHFQIEASDDDGVSTLRMKGWSTFARTVPGALAWVALTRRLVRAYVSRNGRPDALHGHAALWGGYAAMLCAREFRVPYMVTEHSLTRRLNDTEREVAADVYSRADAVIAVSKALAKSVDAVAGRPLAHVVPNAVDASYFHLPPAPRRTTPFTFLALGHKNVDVVVRAFARLRARNPRLRLEIAGALPAEAMRQAMWSANALVLPGDAETFGVEAMATGLPVIESNDEEGLLRAMDEQTSRRVDAVALRETVLSRFDYPIVAERLRALYENVPLRRKEVA